MGKVANAIEEVKFALVNILLSTTEMMLMTMMIAPSRRESNATSNAMESARALHASRLPLIDP